MKNIWKRITNWGQWNFFVLYAPCFLFGFGIVSEVDSFGFLVPPTQPSPLEDLKERVKKKCTIFANVQPTF